MSESSSGIAFYQTRSATDVVNVTFGLLRDQFAPFAKRLLLLGGPFLVLANTLPLIGGLRQSRAVIRALIYGQFFLGIVGSIVVAAVTMGTLEIYHREGPDQIPISRLWEMVSDHGMALFGRQLQIGLVVWGSAMVGGATGSIVYFTAASFSIIDSFEVGSSGMMTHMQAAMVAVGILGAILYVLPRVVLLLPAQVDPDRSTSLSRCWALVKGHWGQTTGVLLLASVVSLVIFSAGWIVQMLGAFTAGSGVPYVGSIGPVAGGAVGGVAQAFSWAFTYAALTLQYYNLIEQHEQVSLEDEVEQMEADAPPPDSDLSSPQASSIAGANESSPDSDASSGWQPPSSDSPTH